MGKIKLKRQGWKLDRMVCEACPADVDQKALKNYLEKAGDRIGIDPEICPEEALNKMELVADGKLKNAAVLMFCRDKESFDLNGEIKCGRIGGAKLTGPMIDLQTFSGPLYQGVDKTMDFVKENIKEVLKPVPGKSRRVKGAEYPLEAVREAVVNAVAHKDYLSHSGVQVRIFDDRLEVVSPGSLPEGWTVDRLRRKHKPELRNPLLSELLSNIGYMEGEGNGTLKMINSCKKEGLPEPEFENSEDSFTVRFRKHKLTQEEMKKIGLKIGHRRILDYLKKHRKVTAKDYTQVNSVSLDKAHSDLAHLVEKGVIKRVDTKNYSYYIME